MNKLFVLRRYWPLAIFLFLPQPLLSQTPVNQGAQAEVRSFLADFITAFENLNWETFRNAFTDDATVFYPRDMANRANGRIEFEQHFRQVFEQIRAGRQKGPYMDIRPRELGIQMLGDVAIVTFHLDDRAGFTNRRTLVLLKARGSWKIAHLHASEVGRAGPTG